MLANGNRPARWVALLKRRRSGGWKDGNGFPRLNKGGQGEFAAGTGSIIFVENTVPLADAAPVAPPFSGAAPFAPTAAFLPAVDKIIEAVGDASIFPGSAVEPIAPAFPGGCQRPGLGI